MNRYRSDGQHANKTPLAELPDRKGWTPLHYACFDNNKELVRQLLGAGADPNAKYVWEDWGHSCSVQLPCNTRMFPSISVVHYNALSEKIMWALQQRECLNISIPAHVFNICYQTVLVQLHSLPVVIFYLPFISVLIGNIHSFFLHSFFLHKFTG